MGDQTQPLPPPMCAPLRAFEARLPIPPMNLVSVRVAWSDTEVASGNCFEGHVSDTLVRELPGRLLPRFDLHTGCPEEGHVSDTLVTAFPGRLLPRSDQHTGCPGQFPDRTGHGVGPIPQLPQPQGIPEQQQEQAPQQQLKDATS